MPLAGARLSELGIAFGQNGDDFGPEIGCDQQIACGSEVLPVGSPDLDHLAVLVWTKGRELVLARSTELPRLDEFHRRDCKLRDRRGKVAVLLARIAVWSRIAH